MIFSFQTKNLELLCDSIPEKIAEFELNDENITDWGDILCSNFKDLFKKYAICHKMINSNKTFSTSDIDKLGNNSYFKFFSFTQI